MKETPFESILRRSQEVQAEEIRLAEELMRTLKEYPRHPVWGEGNWLGIVERWESAETVISALKLCLKIVKEQDPMTVHNLSRQLRRWRRAQGEQDIGWLEVRSVRGCGPYVYFRWRQPGERKIQTEYYGRADTLLGDLAVIANLKTISPPILPCKHTPYAGVGHGEESIGKL